MTKATMMGLAVLAAVVTGAVAGGDPFLYRAARGKTLVLTSTVTVPAEETSVYMQYGRAMTENDVDGNYPHCFIELNSRRSQDQALDAAEFRIVKVRKREEDDTRSTSLYVTELKVQSASPSDVRRVVCQQIDDSSYGQHLRVREFKNAVGQLMELR